MPRVSVEELKAIRERFRGFRRLREGKARARVVVHMGACGLKAGGRNILSRLLAAREQERAGEEVLVTVSGCAGQCDQEPMITVEVEGEDPVRYGRLNEETAVRILEEHAIGGRVVSEFVCVPSRTSGGVP
ncbi:MAG: (2Fe-2S) ferredoxin domain-containing protein [Planctomycetes bacterium]|nr:(2Fe-2S) ferredoxin domain-containing protein [Planctomycetota bacterium]